MVEGAGLEHRYAAFLEPRVFIKTLNAACGAKLTDEDKVEIAKLRDKVHAIENLLKLATSITAKPTLGATFRGSRTISCWTA